MTVATKIVKVTVLEVQQQEQSDYSGRSEPKRLCTPFHSKTTREAIRKQKAAGWSEVVFVGYLTY